MESAFDYACAWGQRDVVEFLLEKGISPDLRNAGDRTGLHNAAWGAHIDVVKLLLHRGAPVDVKENSFHATPLDVALWLRDNSREGTQRERCYEVIVLLARAGATLDRQHWSGPAGEGLLDKIDSDPRMLAALRGELSGPA